LFVVTSFLTLFHFALKGRGGSGRPDAPDTNMIFRLSVSWLMTQGGVVGEHCVLLGRGDGAIREYVIMFEEIERV
jgi:hypothetical protein